MIRFELMSKNWLFILEYTSDTYRNTDNICMASRCVWSVQTALHAL